MRTAALSFAPMTVRRRAFSILETVVALLILSGAGLIVLRSGVTIHRRSYFNEHQLLACIHARTLLSFARAVDFEYLKSELGRAVDPAFRDLDLDRLFEPGDLDFVFAGPGVDSQLYRQKLKNLQSRLRGRVVEPDLIELEAVVSWTVPGENLTSPHEFRLTTAVHRPAATFSPHSAGS